MVFTSSVGKFLFAAETFPTASRPHKHEKFGLNLLSLIRTALLKHFGHCCVKTIGREKNMKTSKNIIENRRNLIIKDVCVSESTL